LLQFCHDIRITLITWLGSNSMIKLFSALILSFLIPLTAAAAAVQWGNGYTTIKTPVRTSDPSNNRSAVNLLVKRMSALLQTWTPSLGLGREYATVSLTSIFLPAVFGVGWLAQSKAFLRGRLLVIESINLACDLFKCYHVLSVVNLNSEDALASFFVNYGVSEDESVNSRLFCCHSRLKSADAENRAYGARGVPGLHRQLEYLRERQKTLMAMKYL